jgi:NAD(P)-dependent dehydrogenase (short-subunit alcohol dehydrogenase family)
MTVEIGLDGAVALVTGAASGIGEVTAHTLARAGAAVAVTDINASGADRVAAAITGNGGRAVGVGMDVTDPRAVRVAFGSVSAALGPPAILVNNAFTTTLGRFVDLEPDVVARTIDVILVGAMNTCRVALSPMVSSGWGRIVNIVSDAGRVGEPNLVPYSAAKAGLIGFTKALAKEVGRRGVTVNGVSPGGTRTRTTLDQLAALGTPEASVAAQYPLGRLGEPQDIANGVLYLVSPLADWVTGQVIGVNGGYSMV